MAEKKKKKWPWVLAICAGVGALAVWGISSLTSNLASNSPMQSVYEQAEVKKGTIESTVVGTGSLAYSDAKEVYIPNGIDVTSVYCSTGESVAAGDLLASVDRSQCEVAMSNTYEQIAQTDDKMKEASSKDKAVNINAPAAGRVVQINASKGSSVLDITSEKGNLIVISPDGHMGATIDSSEQVQPGQSVTLVFGDGSRKTASVENVTEDSFSVALTDSSLTIGDAVQALDLDGKELGTGTLTALDGIPVVGPIGVVEEVSVELNEKVDAGDRLLRVKTTTPSAEYLQLQQDRSSLTKRYDALTELYQAGGLKAPMTGVVVSSNLKTQTTSSSSGSSDAAGAGFPFSSGAMSAFGMGMSNHLQDNSGTGNTAQLSSASTSRDTLFSTSYEQDTLGPAKTVLLGLARGGQDMPLEASYEDYYSDEYSYEAADEPEPIESQPEPIESQPEPDEPSWEPSDEPSQEPNPPEPTDSEPPAITELPTIGPFGIPAITLPLIPPIPTFQLQQRVNVLPVYTGEATWQPASETVQFKTVYSVCVTLEALDGFYFEPDCTATIIGSEATFAQVSEDGKTMIVQARYPETSAGLSLDNIDLSGLKDLLGDSLSNLDLLELLTGSLDLDLSSLLGDLGGLDMSGLDLSGMDLSSLTGLSGADLSALSGVDLSALNSASLAGLDASALRAASGMDLSSLPYGAASTDRSDAYPDSSTACTIAPNDKMQLQVEINQMDILSIEPGMGCKVTVDAIEGQEFDGTVDEVSANAGNSGSYTVLITVDKTDEMLSGMTASAVITTGSTENALSLPVAAIQEDGNRTFVYTTYDKDKGLGGEVDVTTGVSNGTTVEILSGLEDGQTVYYQGENQMQRMMRMMGAQGASEPSETSAP